MWRPRWSAPPGERDDADGVGQDPPRLPPGGTRRISDLNNFDPHLCVYDKTSGEMLAEIALPSNAIGAPMTYMAGGKQFIVIPVGGGSIPEELIAVAL